MIKQLIFRKYKMMMYTVRKKSLETSKQICFSFFLFILFICYLFLDKIIRLDK